MQNVSNQSRDGYGAVEAEQSSKFKVQNVSNQSRDGNRAVRAKNVPVRAILSKRWNFEEKNELETLKL